MASRESRHLLSSAASEASFGEISDMEKTRGTTRSADDIVEMIKNRTNHTGGGLQLSELSDNVGLYLRSDFIDF